jgi:tRNA nucleotidyltransferase (CCA-adding enzyme)
MAVLGVAGGPVVGEALRHLLDRVIEDPRLNTADALASELREWWHRGADARRGERG